MNGFICDDQNLKMDSEVDQKPVQWGSDMNDVIWPTRRSQKPGHSIFWIGCGLSTGDLLRQVKSELQPSRRNETKACMTVCNSNWDTTDEFCSFSEVVWNKRLARLYILIAWSKRFLRLEHKIEFDRTRTDVQTFDWGRWGPSCVAVCVQGVLECMDLLFKMVILINSRCAQVDEVIHH